MEQRTCAGGGQGRENRKAEGGAKLLPGVQEPGGETGLVLLDAGVGCGGQTGEDAAQADGDDQETGQDVGDVGAVDRNS
jgi:hypothetical protein